MFKETKFPRNTPERKLECLTETIPKSEPWIMVKSGRQIFPCRCNVSMEVTKYCKYYCKIKLSFTVASALCFLKPYGYNKIIIASNKLEMFVELFACHLVFPEVDINVPDFISQCSELLLLELLLIVWHFKNYFSLWEKVFSFPHLL